MTQINRRRFLKSALFSTLVSVARPSIARTRLKVVIVGGGIGGLTAARRLATSYPEIQVTVVEPNRHYTTCFASSPVLAGLRARQTLDFTYGDFDRPKNLNWVSAHAIRIDPEKAVVHLSTNETLAYDRVVVSPGIGFVPNAIEGLDTAAQKRFPHSYLLGGEIDLLLARLRAVEDGGLVVVSVPERPYRCTPAPYERVSMIAHFLKSHKPSCKVLVLDHKDEFPLMDRILPAWQHYYGDMIEWIPAEFGGRLEQVNGAAGSLTYDGETLTPDLASIIPPQQAGAIALSSGLAGDDGWCPVDPLTLESRLIPNLHVIGDAADAGDMSKSAHAAASLADHCALAVGQMLTDRRPTEPDYQNVCYFLVAEGHGLKVGGTYRASADRIVGTRGFSSGVGESDAERRATAVAGANWFTQFTSQLFR